MKIFANLLAAFALVGTLLPLGSIAQTSSAGYTQTQHPIVLAHGYLGWDKILNTYDYWYGIPPALRSGGATVYVTQQSAANQSEVRGEQLLATLRELKARHGHNKFNLIGHSHGGQTVRYVAAVAPELVASVTTFGTPHQGSKVADDLLGWFSQTGTTELAATGLNLGTTLIDLLSSGGLPQDNKGTLNSLTTEGAARFNQKFPQGAPSTACGSGPAVVNGIRYYSFSGTGIVTNPVDPTDLVSVVGARSFKGEANDGLVSRCSSRWGTVVRDNFPWNHFDEVNQAYGLRGLMSPDPVAVYRAHANRLQQAGL